MNEEEASVPRHHVRQKICATRKRYRDGKRDTAVKVYTVNQESQYLMVTGVPAVGASEELIKLFALYGQVDEYRIMDEYPAAADFTEAYWIKFNKIQNAKIAKRKLDDHSFFGGILHVFYCPEYESIDDTRRKLAGRRRYVATTVKRLKDEQSAQPTTSQNKTSATDLVLPDLPTTNCNLNTAAEKSAFAAGNSTFAAGNSAIAAGNSTFAARNSSYAGSMSASAAENSAIAAENSAFAAGNSASAPDLHETHDHFANCPYPEANRPFSASKTWNGNLSPSGNFIDYSRMPPPRFQMPHARGPIRHTGQWSNPNHWPGARMPPANQNYGKRYSANHTPPWPPPQANQQMPFNHPANQRSLHKHPANQQTSFSHPANQRSACNQPANRLPLPSPANTGSPYECGYTKTDLSSYPSNQYMGSSHYENYVSFQPKSKAEQNETETETVKTKPNERVIHGVVIKEAEKPKTTPRFVPRQIQKLPNLKPQKFVEKKDELNEIIKRNAFVLGPVSGPKERPGTKPHDGRLTNEEVSIERTRSAIRDKLKTICPTLLPRQLRKRKRPPETEIQQSSVT